ncbi:hypothetical protein R5R35_002877 [Gryllus longicercus]|uniref:Accessory gland protein n=1 Tax=Gryllus longicercus TaxID=2509291 RepID=A0AAN9Z8E6_9ORTH
MGAARAAAVVLVAAAAQLVPTTRSLSRMPPYIANVPTLSRALKDTLLVKLECTQYCKNVFWQYKVAGESAWKTADAVAHSSFPDTFYLRRLRPDTLYVLRALLKPNFGPAYAGDEIPTLEARTCPGEFAGDAHSTAARRFA